jgi:endonuclease IV
VKNKLQITEFKDGLVTNTKYKVHDSYTVYMITDNKGVAETAFDLLKNEYNQEKQNAS